MRHTRLPILFVLIAATLAWLHFTMRTSPGETPAPATATAPATPPKPAAARPASALAATQKSTPEPATPPITLPPTIEVAPLKSPPGDDAAPEPKGEEP